MGLGNFGVNFDWSDLPINLADCIQQDDDEPCANRRFGMIYRGSLHTTHGSVLKVCMMYPMVSSPSDHQCFFLGCDYNHHDRVHE